MTWSPMAYTVKGAAEVIKWRSEVKQRGMFIPDQPPAQSVTFHVKHTPQYHS